MGYPIVAAAAFLVFAALLGGLAEPALPELALGRTRNGGGPSMSFLNRIATGAVAGVIALYSCSFSASDIFAADAQPTLTLQGLVFAFGSGALATRVRRLGISIPVRTALARVFDVIDPRRKSDQ